MRARPDPWGGRRVFQHSNSKECIVSRLQAAARSMEQLYPRTPLQETARPTKIFSPYDPPEAHKLLFCWLTVTNYMKRAQPCRKKSKNPCFVTLAATTQVCLSVAKSSSDLGTGEQNPLPLITLSQNPAYMFLLLFNQHPAFQTKVQHPKASICQHFIQASAF